MGAPSPAPLILQYTFTATPVGGGPAITVTSVDPDVRLYGLRPNTEASMRAGRTT